jgi:YD repeat-containing protein
MSIETGSPAQLYRANGLCLIGYTQRAGESRRSRYHPKNRLTAIARALSSRNLGVCSLDAG